jgi:hypothetical protein
MRGEDRRYRLLVRHEVIPSFRRILDGLAVAAAMWLLAKVLIPSVGLFTGVLVSTAIGLTAIILIRREGRLPVRTAAAVVVPGALLVAALWFPIVSRSDPVGLVPKAAHTASDRAAVMWRADAYAYQEIARALYNLSSAQTNLQNFTSPDTKQEALARVEDQQADLDELLKLYPEQYRQIEEPPPMPPSTSRRRMNTPPPDGCPTDLEPVSSANNRPWREIIDGWVKDSKIRRDALIAFVLLLTATAVVIALTFSGGATGLGDLVASPLGKYLLGAGAMGGGVLGTVGVMRRRKRKRAQVQADNAVAAPRDALRAGRVRSAGKRRRGDNRCDTAAQPSSAAW